jgi:hypothetical protein
MNRKLRVARLGWLLGGVLALSHCANMPCAVRAQVPDRSQDERQRQLQREQATTTFNFESRQKIASARKSWREGRHVDAVKQFEECLEQARKTLGEPPNAPTVDIVRMLARAHESSGAFGAAAAETRRAVEMQMHLTGPQSWEVIELQSELGRLERLAKLGKDRLEVLSRLRTTVALVSDGRGALASAICIDARGLFLTRARPLANLWKTTTTHLDYHPDSGEFIGLRTEYNPEESLGMFVVLNPGLPDLAILAARVVRTAATEDLALLAVPAITSLASVELARGEVPEVGKETIVLNLWNAPVKSRGEGPEAMFLRACPCKVAAVRSLNGRPWIFQLDASMPPGGPEGMVLDNQGRLLGFAIKGLAGTGVAYTIPTQAIEEFRGKAIVMAPAPAISYRARKGKHDWAIPIWVADPKAKEIAVELAFGESRSFRSTGVGEQPGTLVVKVVPVDPKTVDRVDLLVRRGIETTRYTADDRDVSVGPTKLRLSDLRRLELGGERRGIAADGRIMAGAPSGLEGLKGHSGGKAVPVDLRDATRLDVVYPPESVEPLTCELVVRSRDEVLLRERYPVRLRESLVELGGMLDVTHAVASTDRGHDQAVVAPSQDREITLNGMIAAVTVGGGGRYVLLTLSKPRKLVVFDSLSQRLAAEVPLVDDDVLVAAGADAFFLVYPGMRIIHRWSLGRMALDRTAALPIRGDVKAVALGRDSAGPLLFRWVNQQGGGRFTQTEFSFIDPESLKVLECSTFHERTDHTQREQPGPIAEPGALRLARYVTGREEVNLRASPRGDVFCLWQSGVSPAGFVTLKLKGSEVWTLQLHLDFGHLIPSPEGRTVFTGSGERLDLEGKPRGGAARSPQPGPAPAPNQPPSVPQKFVPSADPAYYLAIKGLGGGHPPSPRATTIVVAFNALGIDRELESLELPWPPPRPVAAPPPTILPAPMVNRSITPNGSTASLNSPSRFGFLGQPDVSRTFTPGRTTTSFTYPHPTQFTGTERRPDDDQRFHWLPQAELLVVIPPTDDRLILRRVRLNEFLAKLRENDLFLSSPRGFDVPLGMPFHHTLAARSGRGQAEFKLSRGPAGLRLSPVGELGWEAPTGKPGEEVEAVVEVGTAAGTKISETIILRLLSTRRATP